MVTVPAFRFGVCLFTTRAEEWSARSRAAEDMGYDVIAMTDYLSWLPPFPGLAVTATATRTSRIGTYAINPALWNPAVLAREVLGTDRLSGGRLELGLSSGFLRDQYEAAGVGYGDVESRLRLLDTALEVLHEAAAAAERPVPPLLLAAREDLELDFAAERADIVGIVGAALGADGIELLSAEAIAEQVRRVRSGPAGAAAELNIAIKHVEVAADRARAAARLRPKAAPHLTDEEFLELPHVLIGTHEEMADQLRRSADRYGFTYITVLDEAMERFAPVIGLLRE